MTHHFVVICTYNCDIEIVKSICLLGRQVDIMFSIGYVCVIGRDVVPR